MDKGFIFRKEQRKEEKEREGESNFPVLFYITLVHSLLDSDGRGPLAESLAALLAVT